MNNKSDFDSDYLTFFFLISFIIHKLKLVVFFIRIFLLISSKLLDVDLSYLFIYIFDMRPNPIDFDWSIVEFDDSDGRLQDDTIWDSFPVDLGVGGSAPENSVELAQVPPRLLPEPAELLPCSDLTELK